MLWSIHLLGILLLITAGIILSSTGQEAYSVQSDETSYNEARQNCHLARPELAFIDDKPVFDFGDQDLSLKVGDEAWVGYVSAFATYQYRGCVRRRGIADVSGPYETGARPGFCQVACDNHRYFGIMKDQCYCFHSLPTVDIQRATCELDCKQPSHGGVCGDRRSVSIYEQVNISIEAFQGVSDGNCLSYDKNARTFRYTKCSLSFAVGCMSEANIPFEFQQTVLSWTDTTRYCFKQRLFPLSNISFVNFKGSSNHIWTGMFRSLTIFKSFSDNAQQRHQENGYVYVEADGLASLRFGSGMNSVKKKYICQGSKSESPAGLNLGPTTSSTIFTIEPSNFPSRSVNTSEHPLTTSGSTITTSETSVAIGEGNETTDGTPLSSELKSDKALINETANKPSKTTRVIMTTKSVTQNDTEETRKVTHKTTMTIETTIATINTTIETDVTVETTRGSTMANEISLYTRNVSETDATNAKTKDIRKVTLDDEKDSTAKTNTDDKPNFTPVFVLVPTLCGLAILIFIIVVIVKRRRTKRRRRNETEEEMPSWVTLADTIFDENIYRNDEHI